MTNDLLAIGTSVAAAIISLATILPKLLTGFKKDKLEGAVATTQHKMVDGIQNSYEKQLSSLTERYNKLDLKVDSMDETIHTQAVKLTRLVVVLIHVKGLLEEHEVPVPPHMQAEIDSLLPEQEPQ